MVILSRWGLSFPGASSETAVTDCFNLRGPDLDGLPRDWVQVVVTEVQLLQCQQVVERSLVDEHQLVVVQDEVVELGHAAERVIAYPRQSVTADRAQEENHETHSDTLHLSTGLTHWCMWTQTCWGVKLWGFPDRQRHEVWWRRWCFWIMWDPPAASCLQSLSSSRCGHK